MSEIEQLPDYQALFQTRRPARPRPGGALVHYAFVPLLIGVATIPWWHHQESGRAFGGAWQQMASTSAMLFFSIFLVWCAEQLYPAKAEWNSRPFSTGARGLWQLGRDLIYLLGGTQLTAFLIVRAEPFVNPTIDRLRLGAVSLWPSGVPDQGGLGLPRN